MSISRLQIENTTKWLKVVNFSDAKKSEKTSSTDEKSFCNQSTSGQEIEQSKAEAASLPKLINFYNNW